MELLYVWIEDYKNIYHKGFNFSPRYRFEPTDLIEKQRSNLIKRATLRFELNPAPVGESLFESLRKIIARRVQC